MIAIRFYRNSKSLFLVQAGILVVLTFMSSSSLACSIPPKHLYETNKELVRNTEIILLAQTVSMSDDLNHSLPKFSFESVQLLKGEELSEEIFTLNGYIAEETDGAPGDFDGHRLPEFWAFDAGNAIQRILTRG